MKNSLSSDLTRSAMTDDYVLSEVDNERILSLTDSIGVAGVLISLSMNGLPDSGHPSNSSSSSWTVGKLGMLSSMASLICDVAAGAAHGRLAS